MASKRYLYIVRHAKSSWDYEEVSDMDSPLKLRGIRDAYDMARTVKIEYGLPSLFISSPANRALHTANIFLRVFGAKFSLLNIDERLYETGTGVVRKLISEQSDEVSSLMIFGHNPTFSELASVLSSELYVDMPTCGIYRIEFDTPNWELIAKENMTDVSFVYPKKH